MKLKWNMNDVAATRGNTRSCIAKFDNSRVWLAGDAIMSVQTFMANIREIAKFCGAKMVEVKYLHMEDEAGTLSEPRENIVRFYRRHGKDYRFFKEEVDISTGRTTSTDFVLEQIFTLHEGEVTMEKLIETKITTTNGKQYQIVLERYTKGKEPYPFHTSVVAVTDKNTLLSVYTDLDRSYYDIVNMMVEIIKDMGAECTCVTKNYD